MAVTRTVVVEYVRVASQLEERIARKIVLTPEPDGLSHTYIDSKL